MDAKQSDELRLCPFCWGAAETDKYAPNMAYCVDGLSGADNENKKCYNDAILSVEDWNNRPIEDAQAAKIKVLEQSLKAYANKVAQQNAEISGMRAEIEGLNAALDEMGQMTVCNVGKERIRLEKALDEIAEYRTHHDISARLHIDKIKAVARAAREPKSMRNSS